MKATFLGFWEKLERPIIGLSPMDGVTDFAFRAMMAKHGRPSVIFTEFVTATGMFYAPERILREFEYTEAERPIVAQIFGNNPDDFYKAAHVICELGFDGLDINMGCPSKTVERKCGGAGLIREPKLALEIIAAVRNGIQDWVGGQTLEKLKLKAKLIDEVNRMNNKRGGSEDRKQIPYSVKTRLGVDTIVIEDWVEKLLQEKPAVISIHGRTLRQMYRGDADWEAIGRAAKIIKQTATLVFGNGDIDSRETALKRIETFGVDGVLLGRTAMGNPWVFEKEQKEVVGEDRIALALEHALYFSKTHPDRHFASLRKHFARYLRCFPEASALRQKAVQTSSYPELAAVLKIS